MKSNPFLATLQCFDTSELISGLKCRFLDLCLAKMFKDRKRQYNECPLLIWVRRVAVVSMPPSTFLLPETVFHVFLSVSCSPVEMLGQDLVPDAGMFSLQPE